LENVALQVVQEFPKAVVVVVVGGWEAWVKAVQAKQRVYPIVKQCAWKQSKLKQTGKIVKLKLDYQHSRRILKRVH
jgi:hypothetical protein